MYTLLYKGSEPDSNWDVRDPRRVRGHDLTRPLSKTCRWYTAVAFLNKAFEFQFGLMVAF